MNPIREARLAAEKAFLLDVLVQTGGNITAASRFAMVDRSNFKRLLKRHAISVVREGDLLGGGGTDE